MTRSDIKQARQGIEAQIAINKSTITVMRVAMIDSGMGDGALIPDPYGNQEPKYFTCRITHESKGPDDLATSPAGFSTNLARMILAPYNTGILQGDKFTWQDKSYEIGPVDPLMFGNAIIGYQAPLKEAV
jgi:hypothetical protein